MGYVACLLELSPDPRVSVDNLGPCVTSACLWQLALRLTGEYRQQGLWRSVADDVVAFQHDGAESLHEILVRLRQVPGPRQSRHGIEAEHEDVECSHIVGRMTFQLASVQLLSVHDPRVQILVGQTIRRDIFGLKEVTINRLSVSHLQCFEVLPFRTKDRDVVSTAEVS